MPAYKQDRSTIVNYSHRPDPTLDPYRQLASAVIWSGLKTLRNAVALNKEEDIKKEKTFLLSDSCFHQLLTLKDETYLTMVKLIENQEDWMNATKEERKKGIRK